MKNLEKNRKVKNKDSIFKWIFKQVLMLSSIFVISLAFYKLEYLKDFNNYLNIPNESLLLGRGVIYLLSLVIINEIISKLHRRNYNFKCLPIILLTSVIALLLISEYFKYLPLLAESLSKLTLFKLDVLEKTGKTHIIILAALYLITIFHIYPFLFKIINIEKTYLNVEGLIQVLRNRLYKAEISNPPLIFRKSKRYPNSTSIQKKYLAVSSLFYFAIVNNVPQSEKRKSFILYVYARANRGFKKEFELASIEKCKKEALKISSGDIKLKFSISEFHNLGMWSFVVILLLIATVLSFGAVWVFGKMGISEGMVGGVVLLFIVAYKIISRFRKKNSYK